MTDFRALCAELAAELQGYKAANPMHDRSLLSRARAALAEGEAVGPSDEELLELAATNIDPYDQIRPGEYEAETECAVEVYGSELVAFARAVLARYGSTPPRPVPVAERLPGAEDCDQYGCCWYWLPINAAWHYRDPSQAEGVNCSHWLPAHALPIPTQENNATTDHVV